MGIHNKRQLFAAIACYWLVALLAYMVILPGDFTRHVLGLVP